MATIEDVIKRLEVLTNIQQDVTSIKQEVSDIRAKMLSLENDLKAQTANLENATRNIEGVKMENAQLKSELAFTQYQLRKNNLVILNLEINFTSYRTAKDDLKKFFDETMQVSTIKVEDIDSIVNVTNNRGHMIIVRFNSFSKRADVWAAKKNLKGKNTYIHEDLPVYRINRKKVLPAFIKARGLNIRASLIRDFLIIEGKKFDSNNINTLDFNQFSHGTRSYDKLQNDTPRKREHRSTVRMDEGGKKRTRSPGSSLPLTRYFKKKDGPRSPEKAVVGDGAELFRP